MNVKKIGKAIAIPEEELWGVVAKSEQFLMNKRMVELRPEVKKMRTVFTKFAGKRTPATRKSAKRDEYYLHRESLRAELKRVLAKVYEDIREESFDLPIQLRKNRDTDHKSDFRYCLYRGIIYQFDRPGYRDEDMIAMIQKLETPRE